MTRAQFIDFIRQFRRPYASIICSTTLAGGAIIGGFTGHFMPEGLAWVFAAIVVGDGIARAAEKIQGRADAGSSQ